MGLKGKTVQKFLPLNVAGITLATKGLYNGDIVAFPTETVYGLAARADEPDALDKLYNLKNRSFDKPLPLCLAHKHAADSYAEVSPTARRLMNVFWPGPLTIVLPALSVFRLAPHVYGPDDTVALRRPDAPFINMLSDLSVHLPLALTSANLSDHPEARSAHEVEQSLGENVRFIVDGGTLAQAKPSTIVRVIGNDLEILREGDLTLAEIETALSGDIHA